MASWPLAAVGGATEAGRGGMADAANHLLRVMVGFSFEIGYTQRPSRTPLQAARLRDSKRQEFRGDSAPGLARGVTRTHRVQQRFSPRC